MTLTPSADTLESLTQPRKSPASSIFCVRFLDKPLLFKQRVVGCSVNRSQKHLN